MRIGSLSINQRNLCNHCKAALVDIEFGALNFFSAKPLLISASKRLAALIRVTPRFVACIKN
jgi:hypothetical protein